MKTGPDGIAVMHHFEQCILHAYPDPASPLGRALLQEGLWLRFLRGEARIPTSFGKLNGAPWTIGWGDTGPDVVPGLRITQQEADARMERRLAREFEPGVLAALKCKPTQSQFDALVSFAYNLGLGNLRASTLLRNFNAGNVPMAALQFLMWNRAGGRPMLGLTRRRNAEKWVFEGVPAAEAIARAAKIEAV